MDPRLSAAGLVATPPPRFRHDYTYGKIDLPWFGGRKNVNVIIERSAQEQPPTDWQIESFSVVTGPVKLRKHIDENGAPQVFDNPDAINNGVDNGTPIRLPYPGEAGERNFFRGDGYFDIDSGLSKVFKITESQGFKFAWEVFNVTNSVRFDTNPTNSLGVTLTGGNLGIYSKTYSKPRVMQWSLRYDF